MGHRITWCGWTFNFAQETVHLATEKLSKLRTQLQSMTRSKKIMRKRLEQCIGLLMWATSTCRHLRPYLAPLFQDLRSAKGSLKQIHPSQWQHFLDALGPDAAVQRQPMGLWMPLHAHIVDVGSAQIHSKAGIPRVPPARKATWVRVSDPTRAEIHLRDESRQAIAWLSSCFVPDRVTTIRQRPTLHCCAAADAMAQQHTVGIGGWIITASQCAWFSESWSMQHIRTVWPQLQEDAQKYIACFETLAQLAFAMMAHQCCASKQWSFALPSASDNSPTEAGLDRLWSTAEPLRTFLKLAAAWAARHHVTFNVTHIAGEKTTWADALSRGKPTAFAKRPQQRRRIKLEHFLDATGCITLHPPKVGPTSFTKHSVQATHRQKGPHSCTHCLIVVTMRHRSADLLLLRQLRFSNAEGTTTQTAWSARS